MNIDPLRLFDPSRLFFQCPGRSPRGHGRAMSWIAISLLLLWLEEAPAAQSAPPPRVAIPGWRMDLLMEAPVLRHPSVVACAPDGRIFVGERLRAVKSNELSIARHSHLDGLR